MAIPIRFSKSGRHGTPAASDGPSVTYEAYACREDLHDQDVRRGFNSYDVASWHHSTNTLDHQMIDLTKFLEKNIAGTIQKSYQ